MAITCNWMNGPVYSGIQAHSQKMMGTPSGWKSTERCLSFQHCQQNYTILQNRLDWMEDGSWPRLDPLHPDPDTGMDLGIVFLISQFFKVFEKTSGLTLCYHELSRPDFFDNLHHIRGGI